MTSIALTDEQLARLRRHAESSGLSIDEVVRAAVDAYLAQRAESMAARTARPASDAADTSWVPPAVRTGSDGAQMPIPPAMSPDEVDELLAQASPQARGDYVRGWLRKRGGDVIHEPPPSPRDPAWQARFDEALARIRAHVPTDMTSDEIETLITEASEEARQERIARRERGGA